MDKLRIKITLLCVLIYAGHCLAQFDLDKMMAMTIDASAYVESEQSLLFLNGDAVQFYSLANENEPAFSAKSIENYPEWDVVSAALPWQENEVLLFNDQNYIVYKISESTISEEGIWKGLPEEWEGGLDAACRWDEDQYLFFYGTEVVSYNSALDTYEEPDLIENWEGWPDSWATGIDSAANVGAGIIYFFRGPTYIAYDLETGIFEKPTQTSVK